MNVLACKQISCFNKNIIITINAAKLERAVASLQYHDYNEPCASINCPGLESSCKWSSQLILGCPEVHIQSWLGATDTGD